MSGQTLDRSLFVGMSPSQQLAYYSEFGCLLIPDAVDPDQVARVLEANEKGETPVRGDYQDEWPGSHRMENNRQGHDLEHVAGDAKMILAKAGDAVMFHCCTIHGGGVMQSQRARPSVFLSYRPGWAAPLHPVPEWPEAVVAKASPELRALLVGQNDGLRLGPDGIVWSD